jgi:hypothetical protein
MSYDRRKPDGQEPSGLRSVEDALKEANFNRHNPENWRSRRSQWIEKVYRRSPLKNYGDCLITMTMEKSKNLVEHLVILNKPDFCDLS